MKSEIVVLWKNAREKFELKEKAVFTFDKDLNNQELFTYSIPNATYYPLAIQFIIPQGFITDFGSIPIIFKPFFDPIGREAPAYLLHDYLCALSNEGKLPRKIADRVLLIALKECHTSKYRAFMIYSACRIYGEVKELLARLKSRFCKG